MNHLVVVSSYLWSELSYVVCLYITVYHSTAELGLAF